MPRSVSCRFLVVDCGFETSIVRQCGVTQPAQLSWERIKEIQESIGASGVLACGVAFTDITSSGAATPDVQEIFPQWIAAAAKNAGSGLLALCDPLAWEMHNTKIIGLMPTLQPTRKGLLLSLRRRTICGQSNMSPKLSVLLTKNYVGPASSNLHFQVDARDAFCLSLIHI